MTRWGHPMLGMNTDTLIITAGSVLVALITAGFAFLTVVIQRARSENRTDHGTTTDAPDRLERLVKAHGRRLRAQEKRLKLLEEEYRQTHCREPLP